jgi:hypothetical protein
MGTVLIQYRSFCCSVKNNCLPSLTTGANFLKPECVICATVNEGAGPVRSWIKKIRRSVTMPAESPTKIKRRAFERLAISGGLALGTAAWNFHRSSSAGCATIRPRRPGIRRTGSPSVFSQFWAVRTLTPRYEATSCQVLSTEWTRCSGPIHRDPSQDYQDSAQTRIRCAFTSAPVSTLPSPSTYRLIAYLPKFAPICALPSREAALHLLS